MNETKTHPESQIQGSGLAVVIDSLTLMAEINKTEAHPNFQMREGGLAVIDGSTKELNRSPPTRKYERVG